MGGVLWLHAVQSLLYRLDGLARRAERANVVTIIPEAARQSRLRRAAEAQEMLGFEVSFGSGVGHGDSCEGSWLSIKAGVTPPDSFRSG